MEAEDLNTITLEQMSDLLNTATRSVNLTARNSALQTLQETCNKGNTNIFIRKLIELLKCPNQEAHFQAYSYLLNEVILRTKRIWPGILQVLEQAYSSMLIQQIPISKILNRQQNILKLAVTVICQPSFHRWRSEWIQSNFTSLAIKPERLMFLSRLLELIVEELPRQMRRKQVKLNELIFRAIMDMLRQINYENLSRAVNLSYFLAIFRRQLWRAFLVTLSNPSTHPSIKVKIFKRFYEALTFQAQSLDFQECWDTYFLTKSFAYQCQKASNEEELTVVMCLVGIMERTMNMLLTTHAENSPSKEKINQQILEFRQFDQVIHGLMNIINVSEFEDDTEKTINKSILDLITIYTQNMREEELAGYLQRFIRESGFPEQKILFFLSGAPRSMLAVFGAEGLILRIITKEDCPEMRTSNAHLLFIEKYIKSSYFMGPALLQVLEQYCISLINKYEEQIKNQEYYHNKNNKQQVTKTEETLLIKIAFLIGIFFSLTKFINLTKVNAQSRFHIINIQCISFKVLTYLTSSWAGLPQLAHEKIYDGLVSLIEQDNPIYNSRLCFMFMQVYVNQILSLGELKGRQKTKRSKVIQQLLTLITRTISVDVFDKPGAREYIQEILAKFDTTDMVISKEILYLLKQCLKICNKILITLPDENVMMVITKQLDCFNPGLSGIIEELFFADKIHDFQNAIANRLDYNYLATINDIIKDFLQALKVVIELSIYTTCFNFVEEITMKLIEYMEEQIPYINKLCSLTIMKQPSTYKEIKKLQRLPVYLDCLIDTLYLNPLWRSHHQSLIKYRIIKTYTYGKCKERIEEYVAGDLTKMLAQLNIDTDEKEKQIDRWEKAYFDLLEGSGIGQFLSEMDKGYEIAELMIMIEPHHINFSAIIPFAE